MVRPDIHQNKNTSHVGYDVKTFCIITLRGIDFLRARTDCTPDEIQAQINTSHRQSIASPYGIKYHIKTTVGNIRYLLKVYR